MTTAAMLESFARVGCDMKDGVASDFRARPLVRPLHRVISDDNEAGCGGVKGLIRDLAESGLRPNLSVNNEPPGMQPMLAHEGKKLTVRGLPGHSGEPPKILNGMPAAGAGSELEACDRVIRRMADRLPA
jgi:hypothetical protein